MIHFDVYSGYTPVDILSTRVYTLSMSRKDYILIAAEIKDAMDSKEDIASHLASALKSDNPNFNRNRFIEACGLEVE